MSRSLSEEILHRFDSLSNEELKVVLENYTQLMDSIDTVSIETNQNVEYQDTNTVMDYKMFNSEIVKVNLSDENFLLKVA